MICIQFLDNVSEKITLDSDFDDIALRMLCIRCEVISKSELTNSGQFLFALTQRKQAIICYEIDSSGKFTITNIDVRLVESRRSISQLFESLSSWIALNRDPLIVSILAVLLATVF